MPELKPCPFCGAAAVLETFTTAMEKIPRYRVRCTNAECGCDFGWDHFSVDDAAAKWNRRTPEPDRVC